MNTFAAVVACVLVYAVCQVRAACPSDRTTEGPCIKIDEKLICPPENYCHVNTDGSNECCSGTDPNPGDSGTGTTCVDLLSECSKNAAQCDVASYRVFMTTNCPKTCNRCGVTSCTDANALCTQWASKGFCDSTFYTDTTKKDYCQATCGFC